jgi:hypothetical protein
MKDSIDFVNFGLIYLATKRSIESKKLIDRPVGRLIIPLTLGGLVRCTPSL